MSGDECWVTRRGPEAVPGSSWRFPKVCELCEPQDSDSPGWGGAQASGRLEGSPGRAQIKRDRWGAVITEAGRWLPGGSCAFFLFLFLFFCTKV